MIMVKHSMIIVIGAFFALILFMKIFFSNDIKTFLNLPIAFTSPEPITELYFENHLDLPNNLDPTKNNNFQFTVHNLEYEPYTYNYKVEALSTESAKLLNEGSFTLKHDEYKTIGQRISTAEAQIRTKINVSLENKNQSIHFWVNGN